jgi:hypothetical protein
MHDEFSSVTHPSKVGGRDGAGFGEASLGIPQPDKTSNKMLHAIAIATVHLLCLVFEDLIQAFIHVALNELALIAEIRSGSANRGDAG